MQKHRPFWWTEKINEVVPVKNFKLGKRIHTIILKLKLRQWFVGSDLQSFKLKSKQ